MTDFASSSASEHQPRLAFFLSVGMLAGSIIALQIGIMRIFAVGSWAHFGSLVVSLAMLGFGMASVVISLWRSWFEVHWRASASVALLLVGPLALIANLVAQILPFNAIFLISDPAQKWRLLANFLLYLMPFLSGAFFLGIVFLRAGQGFGRAYFADLVGSGLASVVVLAGMYVLPPEQLLLVPLGLWAVATASWLWATGGRRQAMVSREAQQFERRRSQIVRRTGGSGRVKAARVGTAVDVPSLQPAAAEEPGHDT